MECRYPINVKIVPTNVPEKSMQLFKALGKVSLDLFPSYFKSDGFN